MHRIALRIAEHISIFHGKRPFQAVLTIIIKILDHIADQHRTVEGDKPAVTAEDGMKIRNVAVAEKQLRMLPDHIQIQIFHHLAAAVSTPGTDDSVHLRI